MIADADPEAIQKLILMEFLAEQKVQPCFYY